MENWKNDFLTNKRYLEVTNGILYISDVVELLQQIPDNSIDLVVTDPPYNSSIEWDNKNDEWQFLWLEQIKRIMKEGASFYCFFAPMNMYNIEGWIRTNLTLKNVAVWYHPNLYAAGMSYGKDRWKSTWDVIFYAVKGSISKCTKNISTHAWRNWQRGFDVFYIPDERPKLHKAQKPLKLIMKLIDASSNEGDLVLDPFIGSGTTAVACERLGRKWIGIELEEKFCNIVKNRITGVNEDILRMSKLFNSETKKK